MNEKPEDSAANLPALPGNRDILDAEAVDGSEESGVSSHAGSLGAPVPDPADSGPFDSGSSGDLVDAAALGGELESPGERFDLLHASHDAAKMPQTQGESLGIYAALEGLGFDSMTSDARNTLAEFLQREMDTAKLNQTARSEREWAAKAGLPAHDVRRARSAKTGMTIDKLQVFADALGVEPWQMLFPGFVRGSPQFPTMSADAMIVAHAIDSIEDDARRANVAAGLVNLIYDRAPPAPASPQAQPADPPTPSQAPKRQPSKHR